MFIHILFFVSYIPHVIPDTQNEASSKRLQCLLGLDRSSDCPVDGGWSQWTTWGKCSGDCGQTGHRTRERLCNNPPPSKGGAQCLGSDIDTEPCVLPGCSEDEYWKMIRTDPLRSKEFDILRTTHKTLPDLSEACLSNECRYSEVETIIKDKNKAMRYWNALHCVKHGLGCPVRGGWTQWSNWSPCTAVCGPGSKFRERSCTNPAPSSPELSCLGSSYENTTCNGVACAPRQDGVWSLWVSWSKCSVTCGNGIKTRTRECMKPPEKRALVEGKDNIMEWRLIRELDVSNMCSGPNKEIENCHNHDCAVNGQWSGWESWTPCTAECGIGSQARSRTCTAPPPQGKGSMCPGMVSEIRHCFERPCTVKRNEVAMLNGEGSILYGASGRASRLLHMYLRFQPLNPSGTLLHRYNERCMGEGCDYVGLTLEGGFLVLNAQVSGCFVSTINPNRISVGEWHEVLLTVTGLVATLRVDDLPERSTSKFNCQPVHPNLDQAMRVGERFRGQIERMTVNYRPLRLRRGKGSKGVPRGAAPYGIFGVEFEVGDSEESYVKLVGKETIRVPCPPNDNTLQVELAVKPEKPNGLLLYMPGDATGDYILISLESGRIKMRRIYGEVESVVECPTEILPGKWLSLYVDEGERKGDIGMSINGEPRIFLTPIDLDNTTQVPEFCEGDMMIGDVNDEVEKILKAQSSAIVLEPLKGTLGFLAVNGIAEDIGSFPVEENRGFSFSSRTASVSEHYEEVVMLLGRDLNIACLYDAENSIKISHEKKRDLRKKTTWLRLDVPVKVETEHNPDSASFSVKDDGRTTQLFSTSYLTKEAIEGFYICWVRRVSGGKGKVLMAYGVSVVDPAIEFITIPIQAIEAIGILSVILLISYITIILARVYLSKDNKFGAYRCILRRIRGEEIPTEDIIKSMLEMIESPQGRLILGSDEAVTKSKERLLQKMRLKAGEDKMRLTDGEDTLPKILNSLSDAELPPLPKRRRKFSHKDLFSSDSATPLLGTNNTLKCKQMNKPKKTRQKGSEYFGNTKPTVDFNFSSPENNNVRDHFNDLGKVMASANTLKKFLSNTKTEIISEIPKLASFEEKPIIKHISQHTNQTWKDMNKDREIQNFKHNNMKALQKFKNLDDAKSPKITPKIYKQAVDKEKAFLPMGDGNKVLGKSKILHTAVNEIQKLEQSHIQELYKGKDARQRMKNEQNTQNWKQNGVKSLHKFELDKVKPSKYISHNSEPKFSNIKDHKGGIDKTKPTFNKLHETAIAERNIGMQKLQKNKYSSLSMKDKEKLQTFKNTNVVTLHKYEHSCNESESVNSSHIKEYINKKDKYLHTKLNLKRTSHDLKNYKKSPRGKDLYGEFEENYRQIPNEKESKSVRKIFERNTRKSPRARLPKQIAKRLREHYRRLSRERDSKNVSESSQENNMTSPRKTKSKSVTITDFEDIHAKSPDNFEHSDYLLKSTAVDKNVQSSCKKSPRKIKHSGFLLNVKTNTPMPSKKRIKDVQSSENKDYKINIPKLKITAGVKNKVKDCRENKIRKPIISSHVTKRKESPPKRVQPLFKDINKKDLGMPLSGKYGVQVVNHLKKKISQTISQSPKNWTHLTLEERPEKSFKKHNVKKSDETLQSSQMTSTISSDFQHENDKHSKTKFKVNIKSDKKMEYSPSFKVKSINISPYNKETSEGSTECSRTNILAEKLSGQLLNLKNIESDTS